MSEKQDVLSMERSLQELEFRVSTLEDELNNKGSKVDKLFYVFLGVVVVAFMGLLSVGEYIKYLKELNGLNA